MVFFLLTLKPDGMMRCWTPCLIQWLWQDWVMLVFFSHRPRIFLPVWCTFIPINWHWLWWTHGSTCHTSHSVSHFQSLWCCCAAWMTRCRGKTRWDLWTTGCSASCLFWMPISLGLSAKQTVGEAITDFWDEPYIARALTAIKNIGSDLHIHSGITSMCFHLATEWSLLDKIHRFCTSFLPVMIQIWLCVCPDCMCLTLPIVWGERWC